MFPVMVEFSWNSATFGDHIILLCSDSVWRRWVGLFYFVHSIFSWRFPKRFLHFHVFVLGYFEAYCNLRQILFLGAIVHDFLLWFVSHIAGCGGHRLLVLVMMWVCSFERRDFQAFAWYHSEPPVLSPLIFRDRIANLFFVQFRLSVLVAIISVSIPIDKLYRVVFVDRIFKYWFDFCITPLIWHYVILD